MSMNERERASPALLQELGWLTIQWARLEAYVDLLTAYLHHQTKQKAIPRPFNARVRFIKTELEQPALFNVRGDGIRFLDGALRASRSRNELVHGIVVQWATEGKAFNTQLRSTPSGYVAVQDVIVTAKEVEALSEEIRIISAKLFGLLERIKSIFRLLRGDEEFEQVARLEGDRD